MRELQIRNRQRAKPLNTDLLRQIVRAVLEEDLALDQYELAVQFVSASKMASINEQYLAHTGSTDVITFDYGEGYSETASGPRNLAGEIFVSIPDALKQARAFKTTWQQEVARYIVHGILHLRGYDDLAPAPRKIMKREEDRLVEQLTVRFPMRKIAG